MAANINRDAESPPAALSRRPSSLAERAAADAAADAAKEKVGETLRRTRPGLTSAGSPRPTRHLRDVSSTTHAIVSSPGFALPAPPPQAADVAALKAEAARAAREREAVAAATAEAKAATEEAAAEEAAAAERAAIQAAAAEERAEKQTKIAANKAAREEKAKAARAAKAAKLAAEEAENKSSDWDSDDAKGGAAEGRDAPVVLSVSEQADAEALAARRAAFGLGPKSDGGKAGSEAGKKTSTDKKKKTPAEKRKSPAKKLYACEFTCGEMGDYDAIAEHEKICPLRPGAANPETDT